MKATTTLQVPHDMHITVSLDMTVGEMDALLACTKDVTGWPVWQLRAALRESLTLARQAYSSEHHIET